MHTIWSYGALLETKQVQYLLWFTTLSLNQKYLCLTEETFQ